MPITSSASKALRKDRRKTKINRRVRTNLKLALDAVKAKATPETVQKAYQVIDRAAKRHVLHPHKAARLKSQAAKHLVPVKA
jgi:ribosomal protein S20